MVKKTNFSLWEVSEGKYDGVFSASWNKANVMKAFNEFQSFRNQGFMEEVQSIRAEVRVDYAQPEELILSLEEKYEKNVEDLRNFFDQFLQIPDGDYGYKTLKLIEKGINEIKPVDLGLEKRGFIEHMVELQDDGLIENLGISKGGGEIRDVITRNLKLTKSGKEYIESVESGKM